jgi:hypothetical protein
MARLPMTPEEVAASYAEAADELADTEHADEESEAGDEPGNLDGPAGGGPEFGDADFGDPGDGECGPADDGESGMGAGSPG